jgi:purine-cytosine permease-like protein
MPTTKAHTLTSISLGLRGGLLGLFNFLLQYRGYKILGTILGKQASRLLALRFAKVVWVLAWIAVIVVAPH